MYGGFRDMAGVGKFGNGHERHIFAVRKYVVGNFAFCARELVVAKLDFDEDVITDFHSLPLRE